MLKKIVQWNADFPFLLRREDLCEVKENPLDGILVQLILYRVPSSPGRILFHGEWAEKISSYVAGWIAGKGVDVVVLDGANSFDPYVVSSLAKKMLISPKVLLKRIRIARAFTCYQMATLMGERLSSLWRNESFSEKPCVIILGPINTFLDEDVCERDTKLLFDRSLRMVKELAMGRTPFFLFQSNSHTSHAVPLRRWGRGWREEKFLNPRGVYLTRRLFQFADLVWRIGLEGHEVRLVPEKIPKNFSNYPEIVPVSLTSSEDHALSFGKETLRCKPNPT